MSLTTSIVRPLESGFVQVNASEKNGYTQYYKVPQKNAKRFASEWQQKDKNLSLYSNIVFFSSIFAGVLGATYFTKNMDSRFKQFLVQTASAITLAALSSIGMSKYAESEQQKLLNKYKAKEIFYRA